MAATRRCWCWWLVVSSVLLSGAAPAALERARVEEAEPGGWGATLWGWLRPWTWWSAEAQGAPPPPPSNLTASVTVRCGEQTCTTELCPGGGGGGACETRTCGIYDTDVRGFCRDYNTSAAAPTPATPGPGPLGDDDAAAPIRPSTLPRPSLACDTCDH